MRILVYVHRSRAAEALALVARLHGNGNTALYRDTRGFSGDIEKCDRVITDDPRVANAHEAVGIEAVPFTSAPVEVPRDIPRPVVAERPDDAAPGVQVDAQGAGPIAGDYHVEKRGTWFSLIGPDGQKVGQSQRSEADALALIPEG